MKHQIASYFSPREHAELQQAARDRGASVNALVRAAVFTSYGIEPDEPARAVSGVSEGSADPQREIAMKALCVALGRANTRRNTAQRKLDTLEIQASLTARSTGTGGKFPQAIEAQRAKLDGRRGALRAEIIAAGEEIKRTEIALGRRPANPAPEPIAPPAWASKPIDPACMICRGSGIVPGALTPCPLCREAAAMAHDAKSDDEPDESAETTETTESTESEGQ